MQDPLGLEGGVVGERGGNWSSGVSASPTSFSLLPSPSIFVKNNVENTQAFNHWSALIQTRRVFHFGSEPSVGSAYPLTPATHMYIHMRCPRCWEGSKSREFDALSENFLMLQVRRPKNVSPVKEGWDCAGMLGMRQMSMLMRGGLLATLAGGLVLYRPSTTLAGLVPWRGLPCSEAS